MKKVQIKILGIGNISLPVCMLVKNGLIIIQKKILKLPTWNILKLKQITGP